MDLVAAIDSDDALAVIREAERIVIEAMLGELSRGAARTSVAVGDRRRAGARAEAAPAAPAAGGTRRSVFPWARSPPPHD